MLRQKECYKDIRNTLLLPPNTYISSVLDK